MKYIQTFEARGRPKTKWVKCIKDYDGVLPDDFIAVNPHLTLNDKKVYPFFEKGKMYKMSSPAKTINGYYIVSVTTNIKHTIGPPDYEKILYDIFEFDNDR